MDPIGTYVFCVYCDGPHRYVCILCIRDGSIRNSEKLMCTSDKSVGLYRTLSNTHTLMLTICPNLPQMASRAISRP